MIYMMIITKQDSTNESVECMMSLGDWIVCAAFIRYWKAAQPAQPARRIGTSHVDIIGTFKQRWPNLISDDSK